MGSSGALAEESAQEEDDRECEPQPSHLEFGPFELIPTKRADWTNLPLVSLRKFNAFREEFNHERPHEALDQETPASCYTPSPRPMPDRLPPLEYPDRFEVRYVSPNGGIRWKSRWMNVSIVCVGEYVGLEEIDHGLWNVYSGPLKLGRSHERRMRMEDAYGRLYRHRQV